MYQDEVQVGHVYAVRVSGRLAPVRITGTYAYRRGGLTGTNLATRREVRLTAAKCRCELVADPSTRSGWAPAPAYCDICGRDGKHSTSQHEKFAGRSSPTAIAIKYAHTWAWKRDHENYDGHGGALLDGINCTVCPYCQSGLQMRVS